MCGLRCQTYGKLAPTFKVRVLLQTACQALCEVLAPDCHINQDYVPNVFDLHICYRMTRKILED